jgi:serine phosphatase RsbU (regulator of sigma subunit)
MNSQSTTLTATKHSDSAASPPALGGWLAVARGVWVALTLLTLALAVNAAPARYTHLLNLADQRALLDLDLSVGAYAGYVTGLSLVVIVAHVLIAAVIFWRRSEEPIALFVAFTLVTNGAVIPLSIMYSHAAVHPLARLLVDMVTYLGLVSSVGLLYCFPDGRFVPAWTGPLAGVWAALNFSAIFFPGAAFSLPHWPLVAQLLALLAWSGIGVLAQVYRFVSVSSLIQRQQAKWAILGLTAAVLGAFAYYLPFVILPSFQSPITSNFFYQRVGSALFAVSMLSRLIGSTAFTLILLIFPLSFAIAILRYRLWDIDILINRTLVYGALTAVLAFIYFGSIVILEHLFRHVTNQGSDLAVVASTLAIAALFNPMRRRVQEFIDRRFYRSKYDTAKTLAAFSATLRDEVDLTRLTQRLESAIGETIQPAYVLTWLRTGSGFSLHLFEASGTAGGGLDVKPARVEVAPDDPVVEFFRSAGDAVELDRLDMDSPALRRLKSSSVRIVLPLISQAQLIGWLSLGPRLSEQGYSADDRTLLARLAFQAAPAVRVAQLARQRQAETLERERMDHEMSVARIIQQTLLPKELPSLPGWQVAAYWQPARAVGGDFYDFMPLPDGRLAVVVADVADKGVPAAMIMASARVILRGTARRILTPGAALALANDLLCPEIPDNMFITCLYAILDPASGRLQFANAGHNLPCRFSRDAVTELRATGVPLGLLPGMHYEEHEATVQPGESILLYSDGLVEAHNPQGEMFGYERLYALLGRSCLPGAPDPIEGLLAELAEFTGSDWEQEDDVSMVTLRRSP